MVGFGLFYWFKITGDAPKDAQIVEITGKQFNWMMRYPGKDNVLGRKNYRLTDASNGNALGVDWEDAASHDESRLGPPAAPSPASPGCASHVRGALGVPDIPKG